MSHAKSGRPEDRSDSEKRPTLNHAEPDAQLPKSNVQEDRLNGPIEAQADPTTPGAEVPEEVQLLVDALDDKRAVDIAVLDLREASESLDWFIIASGESSLQLKAMEDGVREKLKGAGYLPRGVEGPSNRWVLIDYGYVVAHLMSPDAREFYDLEGLWADANRVEVTPS